MTATHLAVVPSTREPIRYTDEVEFRAARREWEALVRCDTDIPASQRLVILHLASYARWDAFAWPSAHTMAQELGTTERTVKRALQRGRRRGWLLAFGRRGFGGSMQYRLGMDHEVVGNIVRRLEGQRIIRQTRRDHKGHG